MTSHPTKPRQHDRATAPRLTRRVRERLARARRDERGDIPGWVMITVMTITVASAVALMFAPAVTAYLQSALAQFK